MPRYKGSAHHTKQVCALLFFFFLFNPIAKGEAQGRGVVSTLTHPQIKNAHACWPCLKYKRDREEVNSWETLHRVVQGERKGRI
jgi:hypothetical protein